ncbi:MAG: serine/threonine-protein phosphatase [Gammaproteobacteria bacterium]|nr:serine/threonine-protein phosphatase [Gammaproteobacteria bacterium]
MVRGSKLQVELAELSLIGDREENQDRVAIGHSPSTALLLAVDGMGGHADGARAAGVATQTIVEAFRRINQPVFDPQGFLHQLVGKAHAQLVKLGAELRIEARPRATCALCLVQDGFSYWAHVGDSRIYHLRNGQVHERTRDHSHVELLLQEGLITEDEISDHPMRNFVESCLGGNFALPGMTVTAPHRLQQGDLLLVCTDGFWTGVADTEIGGLCAGGENLDTGLRRLGDQAVRSNNPFSDNTSAAALRWLG